MLNTDSSKWKWSGLVLGFTPVILEFSGLSQEDYHKFKAILCYMVNFRIVSDLGYINNNNNWNFVFFDETFPLYPSIPPSPTPRFSGQYPALCFSLRPFRHEVMKISMVARSASEPRLVPLLSPDYTWLWVVYTTFLPYLYLVKKWCDLEYGYLSWLTSFFHLCEQLLSRPRQFLHGAISGCEDYLW